MNKTEILDEMFAPNCCNVILNAFRKRCIEPYFDYALADRPVRIIFYIKKQRCEISLFSSQFWQIDQIITDFETRLTPKP